MAFSVQEENRELLRQLQLERERVEQIKQERDELRGLLEEVANALPQKESESDPCPICWTYSHKSWCYYERLKKLERGYRKLNG